MSDWRRDELPATVARLAARPGHEQVRTLVADLLRHGLGVRFMDHEVRVPEVRGRIDALFGATLFEFKSDLRREDADVQARVPDYLREREQRGGRRWVGIATDGAVFTAYEREGERGLRKLADHVVRPDAGGALLAWLDSIVAARDDISPEPRLVQLELGRESPVFGRAIRTLERLWAALHTHPEAALKRELWDGRLRDVYGAPVGDSRLFLQHTYLTIVAKTIAARVLGLEARDAADILSGRALADAHINGAVESDFFDWPLLDTEGQGRDLVQRIAAQTARFRLQDVEADVLKALYESLIDPEARHDLGEYYTPDWLAGRLIARVLPEPLGRRVLDPACGSGTFLFHAVRRKLDAAASAGVPVHEAVRAVASEVRGLDVHPVAVIIARVTWLLALGPAILRRAGSLHVPIYLGDALQWNRETLRLPAIVLSVSGAGQLRIPAGFAEEQTRLDAGLAVLDDALEHDLRLDQVRTRLARIAGVGADEIEEMVRTASILQALKREGRNHIWTFVLKNMVRPLTLSTPVQQADVVVGNPPWVAFRHLSASMQTRVREASTGLNLWVGGNLATQQDLCALFFARAVDFYLKPGGVIGFVLPYAALNRPAYAGLRAGNFARDVTVRIDEAWSFDELVRPLFPVPASVIVATRALPGPLPAVVTRYAGDLPRRDATDAEATASLRTRQDVWPPIPTLIGKSLYRSRFKQGATIVPRRFFFVESAERGRVGSSHERPRVAGRVGSQDKRPWRDTLPPEGPIERQFLHPVLLGESIGPFRVIAPAQAVLPISDGRLLDSAAAVDGGFNALAAWLRQIEATWQAHAAKKPDGKLKMTLSRQLDHMRKLTQQFVGKACRVVYSASGTMIAATRYDSTAIVEHGAYWTACANEREALYLCAVLNSPLVLSLIAPMQPKGQGGARHFDNLMWELPIPAYDRKSTLHRELAREAERAETVAAAVALPQGAHFTRQRRAIRDALAADGVLARIDALVERLLDQA